ncbi:putative ring-1 protein [Phaeoacremonium minimum UCRPA7]|uniref:RING-type E3 ubiquitin transferase n=1 Tax=Phaeoacremonium minimum (strain UCR-PA7) TaxID=1286976 RepID=R8BF94_PHAM7|nr:putative ring-1 protein [Phaeoacremonium minimum UCRPA7]EON97957.1 putative ring-1 protein [Phaeoacremonium minimum UCRPA7]
MTADTAAQSSTPQLPSPSAITDASSPYPFATAPDIIRAHQKDAYFQGVLSNQLADLHRRLLGARSAHAWATESRTAADLLYLSLTTLLGNRTLGEEYCDLVQVRADTPGPSLPSLPRRAAYISSSILMPYALSRMLPSVRSTLRARLEKRLAHLSRHHRTDGWEYRSKRYILTHLPSITSGAHVHAATLAVFYFSGAYYSLAKRLTGLRYVFTRQVSAEGDRAGYEVLGVLLIVQLAVQGYLHVRSTLASAAAAAAPTGEEALVEAAIRERAFGPRGDLEVSLDENSYSSNNELLPGAPGAAVAVAQRSKAAIGAMAHTPVPAHERPRYDLGRGADVMGWIKGRQQRKCTLCLEELRDPSATQCGHIFCWSCIGDWVREKPECPLCRREALAQHILPLRVC